MAKKLTLVSVAQDYRRGRSKRRELMLSWGVASREGGGCEDVMGVGLSSDYLRSVDIRPKTGSALQTHYGTVRNAIQKRQN